MCLRFRVSSKNRWLCAFTSHSLVLDENFPVSPFAPIHQEKVEEDRYMRSLEAKFLERKKAEKLNAMKEEETAIFQETIAPAMAQAKVLLERTGDTISDAGLEALAKWKLDM